MAGQGESKYKSSQAGKCLHSSSSRQALEGSQQEWGRRLEMAAGLDRLGLISQRELRLFFHSNEQLLKGFKGGSDQV